MPDSRQPDRPSAATGIQPDHHPIGTRSEPDPSPIFDAPRSFRGVLSHLGPGFIITATIVGSGELIVTPKLGAAVGFALLWFILLGCAVKVFVQIELARMAIATGHTTLEALNTLPGPRWRVSWLLWLWLLMYVSTIFQVGGIVGGIAGVFAEAGIGGGPRAWALPVGASCAILLASGRYATVERWSTLMVTLFTAATLVSVAALQWTEYRITGAQLARGLTFELPDGLGIAFAAFGVIGVGASELIYYPYWCLEKGYARHIGPRDGSASWTARARGWMHVMKVDAVVSLVLYTLITAAFYLLGASVLRAQGLDVTDLDLIPVLSEMYRQTFGDWTTVVFLTGAFFVLYSTFFVATASNARLLADAVALFGRREYGSQDARRRMIRVASIGLALGSTGLFLFWSQPVTLVLVGATGQALMVPFLGLAALWFHHTRTRRVLGGGLVTVALLWVSAAAMVALGLYQAWQVL